MKFFKKIIILLTISFFIFGLFIFFNDNITNIVDFFSFNNNQNESVIIFGLLFATILLFNKYINFMNTIYHFLTLFVFLMAGFGAHYLSGIFFNYENNFIYTIFLLFFNYGLIKYRVIKYQKTIIASSSIFLICVSFFSINIIIALNLIIAFSLSFKLSFLDNNKIRISDLLK